VGRPRSVGASGALRAVLPDTDAGSQGAGKEIFEARDAPAGSEGCRSGAAAGQGRGHVSANAVRKRPGKGHGAARSEGGISTAGEEGRRNAPGRKETRRARHGRYGEI